jgi:hypothetical protein
MNNFKSDRRGEMFIGNSWTGPSSGTTFDITSGVKSYYEGEYVVSNLDVVTLAAQPTTTTVELNSTSSGGQVFLIPIGGVVTGAGVLNGTTVVSYDVNTSILTVSQGMNVQPFTSLNISLAVARTDYFAVYGTLNPSLDRYQSGFDLKENKYVASLINNSTSSEREVNFGQQIAGVKGFYANVTFSTDATTDPGGEKQLFSVGTTYILNNGY